MASRRMFNISFVNGDEFLDLEPEMRCLYFGLLSQADDDGFVESGRGICRSWGLDPGLLQQMEDRGYLISFGSVLLIVHWPLHNRVPKDRYHATLHVDLACQVTINQNGVYERLGGVETTAICSENTLYTQDSIEHISPVQSSVGKSADARTKDDGEISRKFFWAAMRMIQITHGVLVCRKDIVDMEMDLDKQLPRDVNVTAELNQLRWQLEAVSRRLLEGTATPHDKQRYKALYGQILKLAGRREVT